MNDWCVTTQEAPVTVLAHTATFIRLGRTRYGQQPVQVAVLAEHVVGGIGEWRFTRLRDDAVLNMRDAGDQSLLLMAGFLLVENDLVPDDPETLEIAVRLRAAAARSIITVTEHEATKLAEFARQFTVMVAISGLGRPLDGVAVEPFAPWQVHLG